MDIRHAVGVRQGIDERTLEDLARWQESDRFTGRERAALAFCEAIVADDRDVPDECFARVREHFSEADTVELVFVMRICCDPAGTLTNDDAVPSTTFDAVAVVSGAPDVVTNTSRPVAPPVALNTRKPV